MSELPPCVGNVLWDVPPAGRSWDAHRGFIAERILSHGNWEAIRWLRRHMADRELRALLRRRRGRTLNPRQLAFWRLVLDLPSDEVADWLSDPERAIWDRRWK